LEVSVNLPQRRLDMQALSDELPKNSYGLPLGLYRIDLLPEDPTDEDLENAFVPIEYSEGFPTLPDGRPVWSQLPFEPQEAFRAFQAYLQQPQSTDTGVRTLSTLPLDAPEAVQGLMQGEFDPISIIPSVLQPLYHNYYWGHRAKAHDLFQRASVEKQRELRAVNMIDDHYLKSKRLMDRLSVYMDEEEDFWDIMTPKVALDMFKTLVQVQRVSVGLPAAGPSGAQAQGKTSSLELLLRQMAQDEHPGEESTVLSDGTELMERALEDPDTARRAQDLILKLTVND